MGEVGRLCLSASIHLAGYYGPLHLSPPMSLHSLFPSLIHPRLLTLQTQGSTELSRKEGKGKSTGILWGREKKIWRAVARRK